MKKLVLMLFVLAFATTALRAQSHEYSPLVEKTVSYKNWTLKDLAGNKPIELRSLMQGKKLVMVLYFAPCCPNWKNEAPVAATLYEQSRSHGFQFLGATH